MQLKDHTVGVGIITLVGLGIAAFISVMTGAGTLFSDQIQATVILEDAAGATAGAAVKVAGVTIGSVSDLALDNGSNSKIIEDFSAVFPWVRISILTYTFFVKTVNLRDLSAMRQLNENMRPNIVGTVVLC